MVLPPFTTDGVLPAGDHAMTLAELKNSYLVTGNGVGSDRWDAGWRRTLVDNLGVLVGQLWASGMVGRIFIDGSFVTCKDHPGDIDGYFECATKAIATRDLNRALNALDPHQIWVWDDWARRALPGSLVRKIPMWNQYHVELFPEDPSFPQPAIRTGSGMFPFSVGFRRTRAGVQKGIVEIVRASRPPRQARRSTRQRRRTTPC